MIAQATPIPRVPLRLVLISIAGVWVTYFVVLSLRGLVVGLDLSSAILIRRAGVTLASMAVTLALWPLLRLLDSRPLWVRGGSMLMIAIPAAVSIAAINQLAFADIEEQTVAQIGAKEGFSIRSDESGNVLVDAPNPTDGANEVPSLTIDAATSLETRWKQLTDLALDRYFLLLAWAALYLALGNAEAARAAERREGQFRRAAKASELRSLRYQVNPHFLFNTLNSLSALVMTGKAEAAEEMIQTLSTFYRRSLADDPTADLSLAEEVEMQRHYLGIEAVRFPERLRSEFDIPAELAELLVPGMLLQPIVENSVKYAVAARSQPVTITIAAREEFARLVITVSDDGPGAASEPSFGYGIGLANVRDRLAARFGEAASLASGPSAEGGWRTVIRLPMVTHD
jgi:signal transduction histidine kinase